MIWLIQQMAAGEAFAVCAVALVALPPLLIFARRWWVALSALGIMAVCAVVVGLCSIPLPLLGYIGWMLLLLAVVVVAGIPKLHLGWKIVMLVLAEAAGLAVIALELPRRDSRGIPSIDSSRIYVIGDSLSAGTGHEQGQTWPRVLGERHPVDVIDLSAAGATTSSIMDRISAVEFTRGIVILEIGGNDVFSRKPATEFEQDLERLVRRVKGDGRTLVMFELPLYPLNGEYGRVQRRVARTHGIELIPRRFLAQVIIKPGNTIEDGLHLSVPGQRHLAELVWSLIGSSLPAQTGAGAGK